MESINVEEVYIDGIGSITFIGGVIRADLVRYSPDKKDNKGNPVLEAKERLIISPQGFLQTANAINNLMQKMIDAGVLTQKEGTEATDKKSCPQSSREIKV